MACPRLGRILIFILMQISIFINLTSNGSLENPAFKVTKPQWQIWINGPWPIYSYATRLQGEFWCLKCSTFSYKIQITRCDLTISMPYVSNFTKMEYLIWHLFKQQASVWATVVHLAISMPMLSYLIVFIHT